MKWGWNGGVELKANLLGECWTFFNLHFPAPAMEAMSRICACKTEKNLQMFGWCLQFKQSCPWATLSYFCLQKQGRKINAMRRVVLEKCIKKSSALSSRRMRRSRFELNLLHCRQKTTTSLWKLERKGNWRKRKMRPQANNAQYNTQGWNVGGGGVRRQWEGGGGGSFVQTYMRAGWNGMIIHYFPILLTAIQIRGTAETRRCGADAVRLQVITQNSPLTLRASYLPLPPPLLSPLFLESSLIATLVNPAHGTQGCFKITSFDKNHWHLNFQLTLFNLLFFCYFMPVHFSRHPLPENAPPFFRYSSIRKSFFPLSSSF